MAVVYRHRRVDSCEPFYVGISKSRRRAFRTDARNKYWRHIYRKYGFEVEILKEGISWEQACELEEFLIGEYGRKDLSTGPLVNMTTGGEGTPNRVLSDAHKKAIGAANKGKKHSPETVRKMSLGQKGIRINEATRAKLGKAVLQYDLDNNFIKEFPTASAAAKEVGVYPSSISKACLGKKRQIRGFIWKYKNKTK